MARYDRIAPLSAPSRANTFACWPVFSDLEGAPRSADAARRARVRFLVLRPIARMAAAAPGAVPRESLALQSAHAMQELAQLPARDAERARLQLILESMPLGADAIASAIIGYAEFALANGTAGGAAEFGECCAELMHAHGNLSASSAALRLVARAFILNGDAAAAVQRATDARELVRASADRAEWLRATGQLAGAQRASGEPTRARAVVTEGLRQAREWGVQPLIGIAHAQLGADAFSAQQFDVAVEHGWSALRALESGTDRSAVLLLLGQALCRLDLWLAAARCFALVAQHATDRSQRGLAFAGSALSAAHDQDATAFDTQRSAAGRELTHLPLYTRAEVHATLGWAAILGGQIELAREHVGDAIGLLGSGGPEGLRARAEAILSALERQAAQEVMRVGVRPVTEQIRRIAVQLEQSAEISVTAS